MPCRDDTDDLPTPAVDGCSVCCVPSSKLNRERDGGVAGGDGGVWPSVHPLPRQGSTSRWLSGAISGVGKRLRGLSSMKGGDENPKDMSGPEGVA